MTFLSDTLREAMRDQTGWVLAGPEANRPENFKEVQRLWEEYHGKNNIKPGQPDMTLFNGDQFLPDWKNARTCGTRSVRECR